MSHETVAPSAVSNFQNTYRMTYAELCSSIERVIETGRLGTPVNMRLHWEFNGPASEFDKVATAAVSIADHALKLQSPTWRVRKHSSGTTLNLLGSDQRGRTLMISLVAQSSPQTSLTIFGNHGIVRLDEGWVDPATISEALQDCVWYDSLREALTA